MLEANVGQIWGSHIKYDLFIATPDFVAGIKDDLAIARCPCARCPRACTVCMCVYACMHACMRVLSLLCTVCGVQVYGGCCAIYPLVQPISFTAMLLSEGTAYLL